MTDTSHSSRAVTVPDKPSLNGLEARWAPQWEADGVYRFDRSASREQVFSIDTPPPTVSGSLHVGHVFSYSHTDCVARYQRMRGKQVFYPMGWDDNGLPTERRVQNYYGVQCDPSLHYDPDFEPPAKPDPKRPVRISRRNFIELCELLTGEDEKTFESLWRSVGLSVDWTQMYTTISVDARVASQRMFLRNLARGEAYQSEAPSLWDVTFQTAVAQAELEPREYPGSFHKVAFHAADGTVVSIETTRPELIPAVVALIAHPDDERYHHLFGTTVSSPVFGVQIPVVAHAAAEPDKGSGIAMCCTFGDLTDVQWWRDLQLPTRCIIGRDGRILADTPTWLADNDNAASKYQQLAGKTTFSARELMVQFLRDSNDLLEEPRPTKRMANFFEKGDKPLEIVTSRQWYLTNGGRDEKLRSQMLARNEELEWVPEHMKHRFAHWAEGLTGDWLISRQRFYGVPFPLWYPLDDEGQPRFDAAIVASEDMLPVDPMDECPPGFTEDQRNQPGGFIGDPDVMDTWATSSITPHIACGWEKDPDLFARTFPMDVRPQAHEIIRTWLFTTVLRSHLEHDALPWTTATISGFVVDPDRKKMSKSKNNAVVPTEVLEKFGADAVRWRAACARPGQDTPFDEGQMKVGRRLAIKILNATKFGLGLGAVDTDPSLVVEEMDRSMLAGLAQVITEATQAFDAFEYTRALEVTEKFFWSFCDDYVELVKTRAYRTGDDAGGRSARAALALASSALLRLFAPIMPFVTEESWSWWQEGSIHRAPWPTVGELGDAATGDPAVLTSAGLVIGAVRAAKTAEQVSQKAEVETCVVSAPAAVATAAQKALGDLCAATHAQTLRIDAAEGDEATVNVTDFTLCAPKD